MKIFWTPLPIVIASIIFSILWWTKISHKNWAKIARIVCIIFIALNIFYWLSGVSTKLTAGHDAAQALLITRFTEHINKLIEENKIEEAKGALAKFNDSYTQAVAGDIKKTEELTKRPIKEYH